MYPELLTQGSLPVDQQPNPFIPGQVVLMDTTGAGMPSFLTRRNQVSVLIGNVHILKAAVSLRLLHVGHHPSALISYFLQHVWESDRNNEMRSWAWSSRVDGFHRVRHPLKSQPVLF